MRSRRTIRLELAYDGTDFSGWQRQSEDRSAQGELEAALAQMHGRPVAVVGAGRTDAGVHALGQVAHFHTDIASIPAERFVPALNRLLPRDLRVMASAEADPDFHARYDARLRRTADPFRLRYAHQLFRRPSTEALNAEAALILGERDFTTFSVARDKSTNRSRYVHEASWRWEGELLVFEVAANAFLWRMVRSLVGSMLHFEAEARGSPEPARELMGAALGARDRSAAGPTAPARGLFLWNVEYYAEPTRRGCGALSDDGDDDE
jgi:tRNA pseudouridine38-40 synthase